MTIMGAFFSKIRALLSNFQKRAGRLPPSSYAPAFKFILKTYYLNTNGASGYSALHCLITLTQNGERVWTMMVLFVPY